ncbi:MAG: TRAM domain-containing protein [Candidatus Aenigmatarchaeota archaeon]
MIGLKVGEMYDVKIVDKSTNGRGVAIINEHIVFIPDTKLGDNVKIKIEKISQFFAIGSKISETPIKSIMIKDPDAMIEDLIRKREKESKNDWEEPLDTDRSDGTIDWDEIADNLEEEN